jgi:hypothetical protein
MCSIPFVQQVHRSQDERLYTIHCLQPIKIDNFAFKLWFSFLAFQQNCISLNRELGTI